MERDRLVCMVIQVSAGLLHSPILQGAVRRFWLATQAGTEARGLCLLRRREEGYAVTGRATRRTGWAAVDAGRGDSIDEAPIEPAVMIQNGVPGRLCIDWSHIPLTILIHGS
jgi:hypothetical protein